MPSWLKDGTLYGFGRLSLPATGVYSGTPGFKEDGVLFSSPGAVDVGFPSRFQYLVSTDYGFGGAAGFRYTSADATAAPAGMDMSASMFFAADTAVGPNPTPLDIYNHAAKITRAIDPGGGVPYYRSTAGDLADLHFDGKPFAAWTPNQKWWVVLLPTYVLTGSATSYAHDIPIGGVNASGRAISFWTNRTPQAPKITAPATPQTVALAGSKIDFAFDPRGPDSVAAMPRDLFLTSFYDCAGVQVQYAPKPTVDNPTPTWTDLPIVDGYGTTIGRGWYIDRSATAPATDGAANLWSTGTMKIMCAPATGATLTPYAGILPSGNWQLRTRVFDYGHPFPNPVAGGAPTKKPLGDATGSYTPATYPSVNTSAWSDPVYVLISEQVPKPLPLYPDNAIAIPVTDHVVVSWKYRSAYVPPFAQLTRSVRVRPVGGAQTTFNSTSPNEFLDLNALGYVFEPNTEYEWQVQVSDADNVISEYSDWAQFWVVSTPASGSVRPVPVDTINGATLGTGTHTIEIYRRGGKIRVGELTEVSSVDYSRVRDDISTAKIEISGWSVDCGNLLASLQSWAYEVVIWRDNGYSVARVWEGPITLLTYETSKVTIDAKDMMAYLYRRILKQSMNDTAHGALVTARASQILLNALAPDDPNVIPYINILYSALDPMQYRSTPAYSRTAFEEMDDMAANAGLDYTCVGRSILVWSTKHRIGTLPELRDADLGSPPIVSEYGMSMANRYVVSDGNGIWGEATRLDTFGQDETYGLVEMLSSTWASDSTSETGTYTQEGTQTVIESFKQYAERSIQDRYPPPVVVRIPDNTTLNPGTVISFQHLVPGVVIPLRSTGTLRSVVADQKLDSVKVVERAGKETISITLSPFNYDETEGDG